MTEQDVAVQKYAATGCVERLVSGGHASAEGTVLLDQVLLDLVECRNLAAARPFRLPNVSAMPCYSLVFTHRMNQAPGVSARYSLLLVGRSRCCKPRGSPSGLDRRPFRV